MPATIRDVSGSGIGLIAPGARGRRRDRNMLFDPPADSAVEAGDYLIVMGKQLALEALEEPRGARK